jgi:hypothetical protein
MKLGFFSIILLLNSFFAFCQGSMHTAEKPQKTIYFFSGLGADSSPFVNLKLPGYHKVYISWIPALPDESIADYAARIKSQITVENPCIVGLSFGGVVAVEVSKQMKVDKMVLISSAKTKDELNQMNQFFMRLGLYRIIPGLLLKQTNFLTNSYFGARSENDKKALLKLLRGTDISLFRWGLKSIAYWDNKEAPERTIQIHGTADKVIAYGRGRPDYSIKGAGHLMVFNKADTISKIIMNYFKD